MKRSLVLCLAALLLSAVCAGCAAAPEELYIFNTKGENADALRHAADAFTEETGVRVRVFSLGSGADSTEVLRTEMNARKKPAIFCVMNGVALTEWVEGGFARPLSAALTDGFRKLADGIPEAFALSDGEMRYGVPFNLEGYGYIADTAMLESLFEDTDGLLPALRDCGYAEWEALVGVLSRYIREGEASSVTLGGRTFALRSEKTGRARALEGVFAVAGSQNWTYGDHMLNVALNAVFRDPLAAANATEAELERLTGALTAYARALDLKTANAVPPRGARLITSTEGGYDAAVENLAAGRAVFLKQGNWVSPNFASTSDPDAVQRLCFLPVKLPLTDADVTVPGRSAASINASIPVFVPNYYVINAKVTETEQIWAEEFLVWLNTSETGQRFVREEMGFIPYNADPETFEAPNALAASILAYVRDGRTLSNPYAGAPVNWSGQTVGQYVMERYLARESWDEGAYADIARYAVDSWKRMRA